MTEGVIAKKPLKMPTDQELNKLSDEHKALLAQKCVALLARKKVHGDYCGYQVSSTNIY